MGLRSTAGQFHLPIIIIYWAVMATASHVPREFAVRLGVKLSGVTLHLSAYFLLTGLFWWNLQPSRNRRASILLTATALGAYAALDEWTQSFIPSGYFRLFI